MADQEEKYARRRLQGSYITTVVSISLVLFMLGLLGLVILHTKKLSDYVKSTEYITKEEAAQQFKEELGEDFTNFLGYNPLLPTIEVRFNADYANNDSLAIIKDKILANSNVKEVWYQESLVDVVNSNVKKIGVIILGFSGLLLLISFALINNTIRLSVYSKRFIIRSMLLVGATRLFISKPFIWKGIIQGLAGAFIAIFLLAGLIYLSQKELPELINFQEIDLYLSLFGLVILLGIVITWFSNYFAVRKYIKIKTDNLYY